MKKQYSTETEFRAMLNCAGETLTAEEEISLSKRILAGNDAKTALSGTECLPAEERSNLQHAVDDGKEAYDSLVLANRPRAIRFARETFQRNPFGLDEFEDYLQLALQVICEAAQTFDWRHNCRFSTWVHQRLQQAMMRENARMAYAIRIPEENLSRVSSLREKAGSMGIGEAAASLGMTRENAEKLLQAGHLSKSFQEPVSAEDPDTELGEIIADTTALTAEEIGDRIDREEDLQKALEALSRLSDEDQLILRGRMGFIGEQVIPMRGFVGVCGGSISSIQKREKAAAKRLREQFGSLPLAG